MSESAEVQGVLGEALVIPGAWVAGGGVAGGREAKKGSGAEPSSDAAPRRACGASAQYETPDKPGRGFVRRGGVSDRPSEAGPRPDAALLLGPMPEASRPPVCACGLFRCVERLKRARRPSQPKRGRGWRGV